MKTGSPGANSTYASLSTALQAKLVSGLCPSQHVAAGILSLSLKKNHSFSELQGSQSPFVTWLCTEPPPRGSLESTQARTYYHLISFRWNLTFLFYTLSQVLLKYSWTWEPLSLGECFSESYCPSTTTDQNLSVTETAPQDGAGARVSKSRAACEHPDLENTQLLAV